MSSCGFLALLRANPNYRYTWYGQIVSEAGDGFNNITVFALVLANTHSGLMVAGILLARALSMLPAGPIAGVLLDRMDRRRIMILSDLIRAAIALAFIFAIPAGRSWLLYLLSAMLMFASPFFTSGRAAILPAITTPRQLHTANSLTQLTQWTAVAVGSLLGGVSVSVAGYKFAFIFNAASFLFSAFNIWRLRSPQGFCPKTAIANWPESIGRIEVMPAPRSSNVMGAKLQRHWREYVAGLRHMRSVPLILAIGLVNVGWATGGGAGQILLSLFTDVVFHKGSAGIGAIWGAAAVGLIAGSVIAHRLLPRVSFAQYKWVIAITYLLHGIFYALFSLSPSFGAAVVCIGLSRAAVGVGVVANSTQLLRHVADDYRGRVFSTMETWTWMTMMLSMSLTGWAADHASPRVIGFIAAMCATSTAFFWAWANFRGWLPQPVTQTTAYEEDVLHAEAAA